MKVVTEVQNPLQVFAQMESEVRSYCRHFPVVFAKASGHTIWDAAGRDYIDFFAGAGALNYGHNNPVIKEKLIEYLTKDGLTHSLDMATEAKEALLQRFDEVILAPRGLRYKVMFPGPTGTNSVEAALKLARKVTGRHTILSFTNGFHGMTIGSLSVTGNRTKREGAGMPLTHTLSLPYDQYMGDAMDTAAYIERLLEDGGSGLSLPAAIRAQAEIVPRVDPVVYRNESTSSGPLSAEQLSFYEKNGYLNLAGFFAPVEVQYFRDEMKRLWEENSRSDRKEVIQEPESKEVRSIFAVHRDNEVFRQLSRDPRLIAMIEQILGSAVYLHQSRINYKKGFTGKEFYWHSDFETWHVEDGMPRMRALSCSISLEDNVHYNGPLLLLPGSPLPRSNVFMVYNSVENRLVAPFSGQQPRPDYIATRE